MKNLLASAAAALLVGIVGGYFIGHSQTSSSGNDLFSIQSDIPPAEFLYLDYGRVLPYLSQLENGLTSSQLRTLSRSSSLNAGAEAGQGIKVGGTFASQNSLQETVTPTAASQFYLLENRLKQRHWLQQLNATPHNFARFRNALHAVEEGGFVRITNCRLVYPVYARLYPALKKKSPALPLSLKVFGPGTGQEVEEPVKRSTSFSRSPTCHSPTNRASIPLD